MRGKRAIIFGMLVVVAIRMWMQLRGKTKTPFNEWAIGFGALFFILALLSEISENGASSLALLVALSDFLINGESLTTDVSNVISGSETSNSPVFVPTPFAATTNSTAPTTG